ncbi:MAG: radical SAM protein [Planctomycetes bacterium]|nr:radical SAM protein [Planctomycetota bacterium]
MRIAVVTPPYFLLTAPACAPSVLTAVLRGRGHDAFNFDASARVVRDLLRPSALASSLGSIRGEDLDPLIAAHYERLPHTIDHALRTLRSWDTYRDIGLYVMARRVINSSLRLHARAHGHTRWTAVEYQGNHDREDARSLLDAVRNGGELFDSGLADAAQELHELRPDLVALSVSFPEQLYGALRLAWCLRQLGSSAFICVGGATTTRIRGGLANLPEMFDFVDAIVLREGEIPLVRLAHALTERRDPLDEVPDLLARRAGRIVHARAKDREPYHLDALPTPVFDDATVSWFPTPAPFLPLSTTRNCYFNKCTFCAISRSFNTGFREMTPRRIVNHMRALQAQYPGAMFKDVSEAVTPTTALGVADQLALEGDVPAWEAYLRFESAFESPDVAGRLSGGGLSTVYFGLESGSTAQVGEINKKIDLEGALRTLRAFADAGIWNHLFLISGLPRESASDHEATIAFIRQNRSVIHSIQAAAFRLEVDSDAATTDYQQRYGYTVAPRAPDSLALSYALSSLGAIPDAEIARSRVDELRRVAYGETEEGQLTRSRSMWDGHKIVFRIAEGRAQRDSLASRTTDVERA